MTAYTPKQAAERLHLSTHTLAKWRVRGTGPKFVKAGRMVIYLEDDLDSFLSERRHNATAEYICTK